MIAVDVDVDKDVTVLSVVDRPVDNELTLDDVEVDSDVIELVAVLRPVDVDVDRLSIAVFVAYSCEPLIASVLVAITRPAATFVTWRSAPGAPTLTTLDGVVPA
ncbi:ATPase [Burkholderia arboris]|uniref:ATPase n=1 Tax=Burkholderia arboris TaxID=488730 RepID=A0A9Q9UV55_9BURK|nr:ATPase [Burkholderia arboris]